MLWASLLLLLLDAVYCTESPFSKMELKGHLEHTAPTLGHLDTRAPTHPNTRAPTLGHLDTRAPTHPDTRAPTLEPLDPEWSLEPEYEVHQSRWRRSSPDLPPPRSHRRGRQRGRSSPDCRLERKELRVRDLGLGYDSDETVIFKYCVGTCSSHRRNYDVVLKALISNGNISGRRVNSAPCCRPTRFDTITFMDKHTTWQVIKWLSAANCSCVG